MMQTEQASKSDQLNQKRTARAPMATAPIVTVRTIRTPNNQARTTITKTHNPNNTKHPKAPHP